MIKNIKTQTKQSQQPNLDIFLKSTNFFSKINLMKIAKNKNFIYPIDLIIEISIFDEILELNIK